MAARIEELHGRLRGIRKAKSRAKWIGHDGQVYALGRQAEVVRKQIAELEQQRPQLPPADTLQLSIADVATVAMGDVSRNSAEVSAACVPPSQPSIVPAAPRPTMHSALLMFYQCFDVGNFDKALTAVRPYSQLADLYEMAQAAQCAMVEA